LPTSSPTPIAYQNTSCIGAFLNNGSFCSDVSFVCPGPVDSSGDCPALYYCFLPAGTTGTLTPPNGTNLHNSTATSSPSSPSSCSTSRNILSVLAILNVLDSGFSLFFGHEAIRRRIPRFRCLGNSNGDGKEEQWSLTAGLIGALIHIVSMLISAGITTSKNPGMDFGASLGIWSMRPRGTFITMLIIHSMPSALWRGFRVSMYDIVVTESLQDLFSLPFALVFWIRSKGNTPLPSCGNLHGYDINNTDGAETYGFIMASIKFDAVIGGISSLLLASFLMMMCMGRVWNSEIESRMLEKLEAVSNYDRLWRRIWGRFTQDPKLVVPFITAMGTFISNWILWGSKSSFSPFFLPL
jgi:hypothetical protein